MKNSLLTHLRQIRKISYIVTAVVLFAAGLPLVHLGNAKAAQLQYRSIQLSDSSPSNGTFTSNVGSGKDVTYKVSFKTTSVASSMVIDFCQDDPLIGDSCAAPTGMSVVGAAIDPTSTGDITSAGWTISASDSPNPHIQLAKGASGTAMAAGTQENFKILHITNPSSVNAASKGTFYARIYTFASTTYGDGVSKSYTNAAAASSSGYSDFGGLALSINYVITITARVQEALTFCVSGNDPNNWTTTGDCGDSAVTAVAQNGPPNIVLGHGSPTKILDDSTVDYGNIWTQLSTNATNGAVVNMHSNIPCGGLSADYAPGPPATGTCAIPAINGGANTGPVAMTAGTAAFGVAINSYTPTTQAGPAAVGSVTPTAPYYSAAHYGFTGNAPTSASSVYYGMDNTTATGSNAAFPNQSTYNGAVTGLFGSTVLTASGPVSRADARYTFAATASITTPAGIYTANLSLIATGTF